MKWMDARYLLKCKKHGWQPAVRPLFSITKKESCKKCLMYKGTNSSGPG